MRVQELNILKLAETICLHAVASTAAAWAEGRLATGMGKEGHFCPMLLKIIQNKAVLLEFFTDFMIYLSKNLRIPNIFRIFAPCRGLIYGVFFSHIKLQKISYSCNFIMLYNVLIISCLVNIL